MSPVDQARMEYQLAQLEVIRARASLRAAVLNDLRSRKPDGDCAAVALSRGLITYVDGNDLDIVSSRKWCASASGQDFYAITRNGKGYLRLHRFLLDAPIGFVVDHINGNTLDNRRINLRLATTAENGRSIRHAPGVSGLRGVTRHKNKWRAYIHSDSNHFLGSFGSAAEAAVAYNEAALKLHGSFALLNPPAPERAP